MPPILVRHASAGDREAWPGDDMQRPLDERGRVQARGLVARLEEFQIGAIYSSPAVRCLETVEPLAAARGLVVVVRAELGESRQWEDGGTLLKQLAEADAVVCGHGGLEQALRKPRKWRKGAAFVLDQKLRIVAEV
ncbi:MAG TPA: phosphoglycerate mutase family protein [Gaiellaceae bacterium]